MPKATTSVGALSPINNCFIQIPNFPQIKLNNLPDISDTKSAHYNAESIIGRSSPLHTYHFSDSRIISFTIHLYIQQASDATANLQTLYAIQSCVYPGPGGNGGAPFVPPAICQIQCGNLLASQPVCVVLQSYNVKFPTDVAWDATTMCPYHFDIDTTWWIVYQSSNLPDNSRIIKSGY
jgi:hypothetical protein